MDVLNILPGVIILDGARRVTNKDESLLGKVTGVAELVLGIGIYDFGRDER